MIIPADRGDLRIPETRADAQKLFDQLKVLNPRTLIDSEWVSDQMYKLGQAIARMPVDWNAGGNAADR